MSKIIKYCQNISINTDELIENQVRLEEKVNSQDDKISKILSILSDQEKICHEIENKGKGKSKAKKEDNFYQVNKQIIYTISLHVA